MEIPFYQTEWLGINLAALARKEGIDCRRIGGTKFYNAFYQELFKGNNCNLNEAWLNKKYHLSNWLGSYFNSHLSKEAAILSVGCGFGVVEAPLIKMGYTIDLQECQPYSIQYMQKKHPKIFMKTKFVLSEDLRNMPSEKYDVVLSVTSTYCLQQKDLSQFLKAVRRILKKDGLFIWYETSLSMQEIITYLRTLIHPLDSHNTVLWGWKRLLTKQRALAQQSGFEYIHSFYFDKNNTQIQPRQVLGIPYGKSIAWQMGVYKA